MPTLLKRADRSPLSAGRAQPIPILHFLDSSGSRWPRMKWALALRSGIDLQVALDGYRASPALTSPGAWALPVQASTVGMSARRNIRQWHGPYRDSGRGTELWRK